MKGSVDIETILPIGLTAYARLCGATLARAHARGGDVIAIDAYLGTDDAFVDAFEEFARVYADQAETGLRPAAAGHHRRPDSWSQTGI